jgi:hypothetical protein
MRQRFAQQPRVPKRDPDALLEVVQAEAQDLWVLCGAAAPAARAGFAYVPAFSWMYSQAWPTVVIFSASSSGISRPVFSSNA